MNIFPKIVSQKLIEHFGIQLLRSLAYIIHLRQAEKHKFNFNFNYSTLHTQKTMFQRKTKFKVY